MSKVKKKAKSVSSTNTKSVRGRIAPINIAKQNKSSFTRETLEKIYKEDRTIVSLVRNSLFHYEMLMALQTQVICLEAKIKLLEARLR